MNHSIVRVISKEQRILCKDFINSYHSYIKFADRPSRKMYWLLYEEDRLIGVFALSSAFARPKVISDYMKENDIQFNELANNIVYCLYGNLDKNAGTKLLKLIRKDAIMWWKEKYGDTLKAIQTFILPPRTGAMYKADNWICLGKTSGKTQIVKTLYGEDRDKLKSEIRTFKNGEIKYLHREFKNTEEKLIFIRKVV